MCHSLPKVRTKFSSCSFGVLLSVYDHPEDGGVGLLLQVVREAYFLAEQFDHFYVAALKFIIFHVDIRSGSSYANSENLSCGVDLPKIALVSNNCGIVDLFIKTAKSSV